MRFSIWPTYERPWDETLALALAAEADGWDGFWYADHYMPNTDDDAVTDGPALECWSVLAAIAATVPRLRLGSLVAPTTVHHPALIAKRAATIDRISGGRLVLGLGAGWQVNEHTAYGIELFAPKERVDRFAEAIEIVRTMLAGGRTTFAGQHFTMTDAPCEPGPIQSPLPILVGTGSPRMLRITARFADEWNTWGAPALVAQRVAALHTACEKEDRDPATMRTSAQALVFLVDDADKAAQLRPHVPEDRSVVGGVSELQDTIGEYAALGIDELIVPDFTLGATASERLDAYRRIKAEVLDPLR
jgi:alkanesulfonate monooxygenase SsuD/methylene tetrahydromethanopterin reductase-like flavin-dependent oxidoreductase (luciferase family)